MKNITLKRTLALVMALVLTLTAIPALSPSASAASNWPSLSQSGYCEYVVPGKADVYRDAALTTRGASNKSYNAYIDAGDLVKIYEITNSYTYLSYPTSSGSKTGYVKTSSLFGVSAPKEQITSRGKATTYNTLSESSRSGYVATNDTVYKLGKATGGNYILVMYTAKSGSRAYKVAFVKTSDYDTIIAGNSNTTPASGSTTDEVCWRLLQITSGKLKYNSSTDLQTGHTFVGTRASEQCKGYAKNVFYLCFGITPGSTQKKPNNYKLNSTSGMSCVGSVTGMSADTVKNLFMNAKPGDFVQMRRTHGGSHSAIIYKVSSDGVTFFEANTDGRNTITKATYTWDQLCEKNAAMSVYTATDYTLR